MGAHCQIHATSLQSGQLLADADVAKGGGALVADGAAGKAVEDRRKSGQPWPTRHIPIGRGCRTERLISENPAAGRWPAAKARSGVSRANPRRGKK